MDWILLTRPIYDLKRTNNIHFYSHKQSKNLFFLFILFFFLFFYKIIGFFFVFAIVYDWHEKIIFMWLYPASFLAVKRNIFFLSVLLTALITIRKNPSTIFFLFLKKEHLVIFKKEIAYSSVSRWWTLLTKALLQLYRIWNDQINLGIYFMEL